MSRRRNPVVGRHPDLFTGFGRTDLHVPLHELSDEALARYAEDVGTYAIPDAEWAECSEEQQQVMHEAWEPVSEDIKEKFRQEIAKFVRDQEEYARGDGASDDFHYMHEDLGNLVQDRLDSRQGEIGHAVEGVDDEFIERHRDEIIEILMDSNNYDEVVDARRGTAVWADREGNTSEIETDELEHFDEYLLLGPDELEDAAVNVSGDGQRIYDKLRKKHGYLTVGYSLPDLALQLKVDEVRAAIDELKDDESEPKPEAPGEITDEVVYKVPGPDGFYVADLRPGQLQAEGSSQGICVGQPRYGYGRRVADGEIKIFSLRTHAGRPKFTIEAEIEPSESDPKGYVVDNIRQVKGKGNRLASKPGELEMLAGFVEHLGIDPKTVGDLQPGLRGLPEGHAYRRLNPGESRARPWHCSWCRKP